MRSCLFLIAALLPAIVFAQAPIGGGGAGGAQPDTKNIATELERSQHLDRAARYAYLKDGTPSNVGDDFTYAQVLILDISATSKVNGVVQTRKLIEERIRRLEQLWLNPWANTPAVTVPNSGYYGVYRIDPTRLPGIDNAEKAFQEFGSYYVAYWNVEWQKTVVDEAREDEQFAYSQLVNFPKDASAADEQTAHDDYATALNDYNNALQLWTANMNAHRTEGQLWVVWGHAEMNSPTTGLGVIAQALKDLYDHFINWLWYFDPVPWPFP